MGAAGAREDSCEKACAPAEACGRKLAGGPDTPGEMTETERWYACYTRARHEKQVERLLRERGFESFLPMVRRTSQWKDRRKEVEWPLFPSYVFTRFAIPESHRVLTTPGVAMLVTMDGRPAPVEDDELANIRLFTAALDKGAVKSQPAPFFAKGQWVEVTSGPLTGVKGVVVEQRKRRRVVIGLRALGQGMEVDIEAATLKPVPSS